MRIPLVYCEEVAEAITAGQPVVALPSSVITHGPDGAETARRVEDAVRASGSVPATIGVDGGRILVGLPDVALDRFASTPRVSIVGGRDLPVALARGTLGATTVSSSMIAAGLAGLRFVSSDAIGGVHRGRVSPDLVQLTRSGVAVVCAGTRNGAGRTLGFLETQGVPLVAYRSDDFPAHVRVSSGLRCPHRLDDPRVLARAIEAHRALGGTGAFLVTTPTRASDAVDPAEADADRPFGKAVSAVLVTVAEVAGELAAAHAKEFPS
ncbi:pseudouridine-5'-phosphate glycosidase [Lentzea sp. NPDC058436]|uniref:pseudouridine-5'-phosphate glycosidase n=1 Tax=Lentzea sp. NPDC058436 TaxID=3346499 RepID=UPI003654C7B4